MRWRLTYLTVDGDRVLLEDTVHREYRHPRPEKVAAEAESVGLEWEPVTEGYWLLSRR